jgi:hypothetical protein
MAEQRVVSNDPMDYAKFVLYVKKGLPACDQVIRLASTRHEVIIQEIDKMANRPEWLRGVPTLVELPTYALHTGTGAIAKLQAYISREIDGIGAMQAPTGIGAPLEEETSDAPRHLSLFPDPRYDDAPSEKKQDSGATLEDMLRRRSQAEASQP